MTQRARESETMCASSHRIHKKPRVPKSDAVGPVTRPVAESDSTQPADGQPPPPVQPVAATGAISLAEPCATSDAAIPTEKRAFPVPSAPSAGGAGKGVNRTQAAKAKKAALDKQAKEQQKGESDRFIEWFFDWAREELRVGRHQNATAEQRQRLFDAAHHPIVEEFIMPAINATAPQVDELLAIADHTLDPVPEDGDAAGSGAVGE